MATYSTQELAKYYGVSKRTFERHLKVLRDTKRFEKTSVGDSYNETDALKIAMLLGFSIPHQQIPPPNNNTFNLKFT